MALMLTFRHRKKKCLFPVTVQRKYGRSVMNFRGIVFLFKNVFYACFMMIGS